MRTRNGNVRAFWEADVSPHVSIAWLGQAGFAIRKGELRIVIDPYLSNCLEKKYRGSERPHSRLMPAPITPEELGGLDYVLCTHRHSDHMDPEALMRISASHSRARFVVPASEWEYAQNLGLPITHLIPVGSADTLKLTPLCTLEVIPSAHETLEQNDRGEFKCLGYILRFGDITIYHSGDCIPYPKLVSNLAEKSIDLALLPINGRGRGVPGNFNFPEATSLCRDVDIPFLIPHHFGMFAFNTVKQSDVERWASETSNPTCFLPRVDSWYEFRASSITSNGATNLRRE